MKLPVSAAARPPKMWKSYPEQIDLLRQRGLLIENEAAAEEALSTIGYYRLSGYAYPFRAFAAGSALLRSDNFIAGSKFTDITALYAFDRDLRLLALEAMEVIEPAMQTRIAHLLGKYAPFAHKDKQFWHKDALKQGKNGALCRYDKWQADYQKCVKRFAQKTFVRHNLSVYGDLPIWVAAEILDFGTLSKLFGGMRDGDKHRIALPFGINSDILASWLRGFSFIRNMAAHHARLWNCNILEPVRMQSTLSTLCELDNTRPFLYFCLIQFIMKQLKKRAATPLFCDWGNKFKDLLAHFPRPANHAVTLDAMNCISGWQEWDLWQ